MKTWPTLYKKTSTGAIQQWQIATDANVIITAWGQDGGAVNSTSDTILEGKNAGRANATTPTQQAEAEAQSQWEKKVKRGYVQSIEKAEAGKVDEAVIDVDSVSPMLAQRFDEQGHKIKFPAYAQPKFDGHRCIAVVKRGKCTLWSRTRKPITSVPHIIRAIEDLFVGMELNTIVLDGELYNHDYRENFEELTSLLRQERPAPGHEVVEFHIYDIADPTIKQSIRLDLLADIAKLVRKPLVIVDTVLVQDGDDMVVAFETFLAAGYEGLMLRNADGMYVNKRSYDLQKVKTFLDDEFVVIGVEEGRGKLAGHAIFVCKTGAGVEFRCKMKGVEAELKKFFENPSLAIGRMLTVQYQGITKASGVPRFPVGLRFRKDV